MYINEVRIVGGIVQVSYSLTKILPVYSINEGQKSVKNHKL